MILNHCPCWGFGLEFSLQGVGAEYAEGLVLGYLP